MFNLFFEWNNKDINFNVSERQGRRVQALAFVAKVVSSNTKVVILSLSFIFFGSKRLDNFLLIKNESKTHFAALFYSSSTTFFSQFLNKI